MHQSIFELIHSKDQPDFRCNLPWALHSAHVAKGEPSPLGKHSLGARHPGGHRLCSSPWGAQVPGTACLGLVAGPVLCRAPTGEGESLLAPLLVPFSPGGEGLGSSVVTSKLDQVPPDSSSFLDRSFLCRSRCLLDNCCGSLGSAAPWCAPRSRRGSRLPPRGLCCC